MRSIPIRLLGLNGEAITIREHEFYYAYHPGGPELQAVFGRDLTNEMFIDYRRRVAATGGLDFRTEDVDLTFVAYIANGYDRAVEAEVAFTMRGVSSTIVMPRTIHIPAQTELFLTILRAEPGAELIRYAPRIRYRLLDE